MSIERPMRTIILKLAEIMREKGFNDQQLAARCGIDRRTIANYRRGTVKAPNLKILACMAAALEVPTSRLYEEIEREDLRFAIARCENVVIHKSSRSFHEARQPNEQDDPKYAIPREFVSSWDEDACQAACEYANRLGACVEFRRHPSHSDNPAHGFPHSEIERWICDGSCHIYVGSPVTADRVENCIAYLYNVPAYAPAHSGDLPYRFLWPRYRQVVSTSGIDSPNDEYGIWSRDLQRVVARRVLIESGTDEKGEDGGLIVVCRMDVKGPTRRRHREGLFIALLGISGPGTLACAEVLRDPANVAELYPPELGKPIMRAVTCEYTRPGTDTSRDNRILVKASWKLVPVA